MITIAHIDTVNFYNDPINVAISEDGGAYVSVSEIIGFLGLDLDEILTKFDKDPRVDIDFVDDVAIISLTKLNGFLMLLPYDKIPNEFREDLLRYQVECFEVLHDYWIHGVAINRREVSHDITSKFKDERAVSRKALTKACAAFCENTDLDPGDLFDKILGHCYGVIGLEALHENEKLTGSEAKYLAWVESVFAKVISKFAAWDEQPAEPVEEALGHVKQHLHSTGKSWLAMADNVPATLYTN